MHAFFIVAMLIVVVLFVILFDYMQANVIPETDERIICISFDEFIDMVNGNMGRYRDYRFITYGHMPVLAHNKYPLMIYIVFSTLPSYYRYKHWFKKYGASTEHI